MLRQGRRYALFLSVLVRSLLVHSKWFLLVYKIYCEALITGMNRRYMPCCSYYDMLTLPDNARFVFLVSSDVASKSLIGVCLVERLFFRRFTF